METTQKKESILKRHPIVPTVFFILFGWSMLYLITSFKGSKKTNPPSQTQAVQKTNKHDIFKCNGTEPFWSLKIEAQEIQFQNMAADKSISFTLKEVLPFQGFPIEDYKIMEGINEQTKETIRIMILKDENGCSDGMSEKNYPFKNIVIYKGIYYLGCCE